jgi:hypothetical protein
MYVLCYVYVIMSVEEACGVCKDRVKWRAICRGGKNEGR